MVEKQTPAPEYYPAVQKFDRLTAPQAIEAEHGRASDALADNTAQAIADREAELMTAYRQLDDGDEAGRQDIAAQLDELDYMSGHYRHRARQRKYEMEQRPHELWLDAADYETVSRIQTMVDESPEGRQLPFMADAVRIDRDRQPSIRVVGDARHALRVPVENIIDAEGFLSWEEGRGGRVGKMSDQGHESTSRQVMEDYARRDSELPPVGYVEGYIQPNGLIVYKVVDGAHRAGAARLRGQRYLETTELRLAKIDRNLVSLEQTAN